MKRITMLAAVFASTIFIAYAQKATVKVEFLNSPQAKYRLNIPKFALRSGLFGYANKTAVIDMGTSSFSVPLTEPTFVMMYCTDPQRQGEQLVYQFYLSPNDQLVFKADLAKPDRIVVTGKGASNNQPLLARIQDFDSYALTGDTVPHKAIAKLNAEDASLRKKLKQYIGLFTPSTSFINDWTQEINYFAPSTYYTIKENSKFGTNSAAYYRNYNAWVAKQDSLFSNAQLNNEQAINAPQYLKLMNWFVLREKERIWRDIRENPEAAFRTWYDTDTATGKQLFADDQTNLLQEKIINKYLTGKPADYAYAILLESSMRESNPKNLVAIYERYKEKFPSSIYRPWFEEKINEIISKAQQPLSDKMIFVQNNGADLETFDQVLAMFKGKTVLLDMWGTWCGPCREEIEKNGEHIKTALKDKGIDYLYVANYDDKAETKWKELIAYFKLDGTHILANKKLTDHIMAKTGGQGFPTYIVIKKDGTYELSKAGYPMDREVLIKQLMEAAN